MFRHCLSVFALILMPITVTLADNQLYLVTDDWPPYEFLSPESKQVSGLSTEIILAVFKQLQLPIPRIELLPWARAEREVLSSKADGIFSISPTSERLRHLRFPSEPLALEPGVLFVQQERADTIKLESLSDLKPLKIGVIRGYAYSPELWKTLNEFGNFSALTQEEQLFKMLTLGRLDAVVSYRSTGMNMLSRLGLKDQVIPLDHFVLFEHRFYLAFSKATLDDSFVATFSRALTAFKQSDAYRQLLDKYVHEKRPR